MTEPKGLLATTDAMVWAQEFCRIFDGWQVWFDGPGDRPQIVDEGLMVGWFANAIMVGYDSGRKATCPHNNRTRLSEDLEVCGTCGQLFGDDDD